MQSDEQGAEMVVEGFLDGLRNGQIIGWAWYPQRAAEAALVELLAGDTVIAATIASEYRPDLAHLGKRDGACGFAFRVTEEFPRGAPLSARVIDRDRSHPLPGRPVQLPSASPLAFDASVPLSGPPDLLGYLEQFGPDHIRGWAFWRDSVRPVALTICENDRAVGVIRASAWRPDLAERRQGDGRCGIQTEVPLVLRDGKPHVLELRLEETGETIVSGLHVHFDKAEAATERSVEIKRPPPNTRPLFSIIVNFYNMRREAERTLTSLSRSYQRNIEDIAYEVLCVDNGSSPPLEQNWVESFGPEFRLAPPSQILPSPCKAINEAAKSVKGRYVAIMIDGAHVLTPGVLREAADALREIPEGIVAVRQWWLAGDQRWLSSLDYSREMEDILFARIAWPEDGYKLFRVGAPILEGPNSWFDELAESNCLFVPISLYERIGGIDESFDEPGAGFANLDLFRRAADAVGDRVISLIGEASFHQFHGGTTTNVTDEEKDKRVRAYANRYRDLRGEAFGAVTPDRIVLRGRIRRATMYTARQRPWFTGELGVTDRVRPVSTPQHFDPGAQLNVQSSYAECGLFEGTNWSGMPVRLAPADLVNIQAMLNIVRPGAIVTTSRDEGLIHFLATIRGVIGLDDTEIVRVLHMPPAAPQPHGVQTITGAPYASATLDAVDLAIGAKETAVVLFAPQNDDYYPLESLQAYAQFVSANSYLVFLGSVLGQPWLGYSRYWFAAAIRAFLRANREFVVDPRPDDQVMSLCIGGFLQRARPALAPYDALLDMIAGAES